LFYFGKVLLKVVTLFSPRVSQCHFGSVHIPLLCTKEALVLHNDACEGTTLDSVNLVLDPLHALLRGLHLDL
jgi:hypothetical protein